MNSPKPRAETVRLGDVDYPIDQLSAEGRVALDNYIQIETHLQHLHNMQALLNKARDAYIGDLKHEILKGRTGLDYSDLLSDD